MPPATEGQRSELDGDREFTQSLAINICDQAVYSSFSKRSKLCIALAASSAAMFSGLSSFIYYPAISPLAQSLHTSVELINLTITSYLIVSGLVPSIVGDLADRTGRRPLYLLTFAIYFASNVGLALQHSYSALFVLRMLQSAGSSSLATHVIHWGLGD